jgi:hypothetical protein
MRLRALVAEVAFLDMLAGVVPGAAAGAVEAQCLTVDEC